MTVIEIRPHRWGWKMFGAPGVEPVFPYEADAIDYAPEPRMLPLTPRPEDPAVIRTGPSDRPRNMPPT